MFISRECKIKLSTWRVQCNVLVIVILSTLIFFSYIKYALWIVSGCPYQSKVLISIDSFGLDGRTGQSLIASHRESRLKKWLQ